MTTHVIVSGEPPIGVSTSRRSAPELCEAELDDGIVGRFRTVVEAVPDEIAVADDTEELTFAEVAGRAAHVLGGIRTALSALSPAPMTFGPDRFGAREPVAMLCGHDTTAVVTLLAILASGHPVLVLDAQTPAPRLERLLEVSGARLVVTDPPREDQARALRGDVVVPLRDAAPSPVEELWASPPDPCSVAALAFTSGSTGTPKPVANDHRLFMHDAWNSSVASGCYGADDTIAHTLPIAFHAGLTTTVHGLVVGACMRLYDARRRGIASLPSFVGEHGCTLMITSPAILRAFCASSPDPALLASLRALTIAGEAAYGRDVAAVAPLLPPSCVVRNRYGSSETGLIAEHIVGVGEGDVDGPLPVGRGVGWTRLDVVDESGSADIGRTGVLTVSAKVVALGYWGLPDASAEVFSENADGTRTYRTSDLGRRRPDGSIEIVGRRDHSVKIRGYLVDPGEVDAALFGMPEVREAVTVGAPRPHGQGSHLVAYVAPTREGLTAAAVRAGLRTQLPQHMVPESVVFVDALPRSERGKIDRAALPAAPAPVAGETESLTHWEELVAVLWAEILQRDAVRLDDDFFALGGDSLAAEELMSRICDDLGISPEIATSRLLAEAPVLREFAQRLLDVDSTARKALVTLQPNGSRPPVFFVAGGGGLGIAFIPLARRLGEDQPSYALQSPVLEGRGLPERSVKAMARRHIAAMRAVCPDGPYYLVGHSFGGLLAFEMAHQLAAAGASVPLLLILDSFPPNPAQHPAAPQLGVVRRVKQELGLVRAALRNTSGGAEAWRFFDQAGQLGRRYQARPWPGRTVVVVAESDEVEQRSAWDAHLSGSWERVNVPGDHFTMVRPPHVDPLARQIRAMLEPGGPERVDDSSGPGTA